MQHSKFKESLSLPKAHFFRHPYVHTTSTYTCLARAPGGGKVGWGGGEKGGKGWGKQESQLEEEGG